MFLGVIEMGYRGRGENERYKKWQREWNVNKFLFSCIQLEFHGNLKIFLW